MISTDVREAVVRLRAGGLVALPTETVYGLAADARRPAAVKRVFEVKGRPSDHPLIVHLAAAEELDAWAVDVPDAARVLAATAWPGPLTMLLRRATHVDDVVTGGRDTIGIRVPAHALARDVLGRLGTGVAMPSANRFGRVSPTTAAHVLADIGDRLDPDRDLILDGGACRVGVESTIVDLTTSPPQVLRTGAITEAEIVRLTGVAPTAAAGASRAAGMLPTHYAPDCVVVLADDRAGADARAQELRLMGRRADVLDRAADPVDAAQRLYADLRSADEAGLDAIVVVQPAPVGIGLAVRDRLTKAAAASGPDGSSRVRSGR